MGAVQVAVGYKLNPSALDLRDPDEVLQALQEGRPISTVPTEFAPAPAAALLDRRDVLGRLHFWRPAKLKGRSPPFI